MFSAADLSLDYHKCHQLCAGVAVTSELNSARGVCDVNATHLALAHGTEVTSLLVRRKEASTAKTSA